MLPRGKLQSHALAPGGRGAGSFGGVSSAGPSTFARLPARACLAGACLGCGSTKGRAGALGAEVTSAALSAGSVFTATERGAP